MAEWEIEAPETIQFDGVPSELEVRLVAGDLTVSASEEPSTLEVGQVVGPPVRVRLEGGRLEVIQEQPLGWRTAIDRVSSSVALSVPPRCRVHLSTVSASVLAVGLEAELALETVSGEATLESVRGPARASTVSGAIAARGQSGQFRGQTVSGGLTLDAFGGDSVRLQTVSGEVVADLKQADLEASASVETVSGAVYLRLAGSPSQKVRVESVSGRLTSAFPELRAKSGPGSRTLKGELGEGRGKVKVTTVSGAVSLLAEAMA
ncbi:MAG TPA: DUF4097 family beta strand repeat-containing protein [Candidatus Dormibacteraeota bacterium]|nr:DUF4097 family beta strand repeat-containing protein [Candidatus Dormibacteraeota bacterium]